MRVLALVDGEHYRSVTTWALEVAGDRGMEVVAALLVGGIEKLGADHGLDLGAIPVVHIENDPVHGLASAIRGHRPEAVLDLSDEPVVGFERRMELAAVSLSLGVSYVGPDFRLDPPITEPPLPVPTIAVIGTGKRVGKTALGGHVARLAAAGGGRPVVVAMGRGGPASPVAVSPEEVTVRSLIERVRRGEHAASDYLEDALTAGVRTIGARRAGGGLAGRPFVTNVAEAAQLAVASGGDPVILEGSGAALPTLPWDAGILVAPASLPTSHLGGYLGPLRVLLCDLVVFIIGSGPSAGPDNLSALESQTRRLRADIRVAIAELQPVPLADVRGKDAFFATTAQGELAIRLARHLEQTAGCRVVTVSSSLADRAALGRDLAGAPHFDVLLTELKAAAVDVGAVQALDRGAEVVFVDNRPVAAGGDADLADLIRETIGLALHRAEARIGRGAR